MVYILHISDLHFVKNASAYNTEEILLREAAKKVENVPQGKKLLVVTGDFHNFWEKDYQKAEEFLRKLVSGMGLDMYQDVFVIPGNHDVGNDDALESLLLARDKNWKLHQKSCLVMLKNGDKSYIEERLLKFLPYSSFVQCLGIYDIASGEDYPSRSHVRRWRDKLNILHLNTALIADGTQKDNQMTDADTAANSKTWEPYDDKIPSIAIGHNNYYDINDKQRHELAATFTLRNVSAYLCGDRHQIERDPEYQTIPIQSGKKQDIRIPNLVAAKSIADGDDDYSEVGFCWHFWDEMSDEVSVEFRKWTKNTGGRTEIDGEGRIYNMRHEKPNESDPNGKSEAPQNTSDSSEPTGNDEDLRIYLAEVLKQKRKSHPSFHLLEVDEVESKLYPNIEEYKQIVPRGMVPEDSDGTERDNCPIWEIIRGTWTAPEHRNVVITGEGGIGKTVAMFSIVDAPDKILFVPALYVPMYELIDKDGNVLELDEYIAKKYKAYSRRIDSFSTEIWDDRPRLLLLLDGFNEIPFSLRRDALDIVNEWYDSHPGAQVIAVSRPMDGLNLAQELAGNPTAVSLSPLDDDTVRAYLKDAKRRIPAKDSPVWEDIRYPLFLNLYVKTRRLKGKTPAGYPLRVMDRDNGGALIWNFLQRELLRYRADKNEKAENWVLRCAVANEYILPYVAYRMVSAQRMEISFDEVADWTDEALVKLDNEHLPQHLRDVWETYRLRHGSVPDKDTFSPDVWRDTVLRESGILIPLVKISNVTNEKKEVSGNYVFMHQHFRDCLAGIYLVNQAETASKDELPDVWKHGQNYQTLDYAAELIDRDTAGRLWEINRMMQQYNSPIFVNDHSATCAILELQKRLKPVPTDLDFSGMDLRTLSLARYMGIGKILMPLFQSPSYTRNTKLGKSTFQSSGHSSIITCMLVLSDGRVVSGSDDRSLRVWDPWTGQCLQVMEDHHSRVNCMALLPNGYIISGSSDHSLRVWDPSTGQCLQVLKGHRNPVNCIVALPDGRVISGSDDCSLRVWDPSTGQCLQVLKGHSLPVNCIALLPDGRVVSGSDDRSLLVWDPRTGQCLQVMEGHSGQVKCIAVLPDGHIVSGSLDRFPSVWDPSTGQCLQVLKGHSGQVCCIAVLPDGHIVSGSSDRSLRVWDPSADQAPQVLETHSGWVRCMAILPDGRVVSGSDNGSLHVWDPSTGQCLQVIEGHRIRVRCMAVLPDGRVVSGFDNGSLRVWDPSTGQCLQIMGGHHGMVNCMTVLSNRNIVSGSDDGSLHVWDPSRGKCLRIIGWHCGLVNCMASLDDGRVISGSSDRSLRVWDLSNGRCLQVLKGHRGIVTCMAVLSDGHVVSGSDDGSLRVWDASTGQCLQILEGHRSRIRCVAVLPDGHIVSGSDNGSLRIWDLSNGRCLQVLKGHRACVRCVMALPDQRIVSGSDGGSLRVWDPSTGQCLQIMRGHHGSVNCIATLPDGHIVSGMSNHYLLIWDLSTGQCLRALKGHRGMVDCIVVLHNGLVVSGSDDNTLRVWNTNTGECKEIMHLTEVNVSHMDFTSALLARNLKKLLWQNGAKCTRNTKH